MLATERNRMNSAKRVVLLGSYAPSLLNFRGPLIAALVARGHRVFALAPRMEPELAEAIEKLGAEPVEVSLSRGSLNPASAARTARALATTFQQLQPDIVIAYTIGPITLAASAARAAGARFVPLITGLGYAFLGGLNPKRLFVRLAAILLYRRAFGKAELVLFQNEDDRRDFRRLRILPDRVRSEVIAGSGVDLDHYAARPLPGAPIFLMIARFLRDKGIREYGEAAARLKKSHPKARFLLAGWLDQSPDAIDEAQLSSIAAGGVELLGRLDDVRPAIASAEIYVLPSYREGTPRSVLEAMAMGRPIITSDSPGCRETVIDGENGFLVTARDAQSLHDAMRRFIEEPGLAEAMGKASRRLAEEKYDVHKVNRAILGHVGL